MNARQAKDRLRDIQDHVGRGLIGQESLLRGLMVGLLADGHVLIEGVPGLAKTRAVHWLASACDLTFKRLQFTPDLLPADVIGTRIYNQRSSQFEVERGPIFANFVLADEINRAPAKVQSALLETMQERQVTLGRETHRLQRPFLVFATQNPVEQEGTYPLPEAQLDRFLLKLRVTYPDQDAEVEVVRLVLQEHANEPQESVIDGAGVVELQGACREVYVEDRILRYAAQLVHASRRPAEYGLNLAPYIALGASPRGTIALVKAAQAGALLEGRSSVQPDDIKAVAPDVLRHRVLTTYYADAEGVRSEQIVQQILDQVEVP